MVYVKWESKYTKIDTHSDLSITLNNQAAIWHFLVKLLFLSLHFIIWILKLINSLIELIDFFLQTVMLNMLFGLILTRKLIILGILSKFNFSTNGLNSLTFPVY